PNTQPQARPSAAPTSAAFTGTAPATRPAATAAARPAPVATSLAAARTSPAAGPVAKGAQPAKQTPAATARTHGAAPSGRSNSKSNAKASFPNSNVREVLKALEETPAEAEITGETRMMTAPVLANLNAVSDDNSFTDTQVLKYLETRRADGTELSGV